MDFQMEDFRHASEILSQRHEWGEIRQVIEELGADDILEAHRLLNEPRLAAGRREHAGGQTAMNRLFKQRLEALGWQPEPRLFPPGVSELRAWKMDFLKNRVGVEVSFNHAEAIAWTFTRLNIAGESDRVIPEHRIDLGVVIVAAASLKAWARMDSAVTTFEAARAWLQVMKPILPIPILLIGLEAAAWPEALAACTQPALSV